MLSERLDFIAACLLACCFLPILGYLEHTIPGSLTPSPDQAYPSSELIKASRVAGKLARRLAVPAVSSGKFLIFDVKQGYHTQKRVFDNYDCFKFENQAAGELLADMDSINTLIMFPAWTIT